jgi:curli biogenesis system outer membrane secretion channel CsgG
MLVKQTFCLIALLAVGCVAVAAPQSLQVADNQVRIAVMGQDDFHPDRTVPGNVRTLPDDLAARVIEHLNGTRRFSVVERTALRRVVREQQFGKEKTASDLDRVIEKTVENLPSVSGWTVAAASTAGNYNDALKEFQDLGTSVGADYIVYAVLEKHRGSTETTAVPFSDRGRTVTSKQVDARLRLRVIESQLGRVIGADSIQTRISETVFAGREARNDEYAMFDHLGREAALRVLDIVFPARLVANDPWIVNRGSNEGIAVGDRFEIVREGKEITDDAGIVIGRLNSPVGSARVAQVQDTLAVLTPVSGEFAVNDLAVREQRAAGAAAAPPLVSAPPVAAAGDAANGKRPRLAVGLVKAHSTARTGVDANKHIPAFTDTLISRLAQTKRFQLIDRQEVDQLLDEQLAQAMTENRDLPSSMGVLAGADYMVIGSIANFAIERLTMKLPGSNRVLVTDQGRVEGNMRIVDARSGEVLDSRKVSILEELAEPAAAGQLISNLADAYADQTTVNLMNAIFPIKVAAVVSGVAYINRGSDGGLSNGEVLSVVRPGQAIIDPDTGVQLGVAETELGEVVLAEVEDARSKAPVGGLQLQTGDILKRRIDVRGQRSGQAVSRATPVRSGGSADQAGGGPLTLAVGKIRINPNGRNHALRGARIDRVTNDLMVKLSQFPEFDVMERAEIDQVIDEKAFTSMAQGRSMPAAMRELEGADYIVIATIDDFLIRTERKRVPYTDEIQTRHFGTVESTLRMVDAHTSKVVGADKIRLSERIRNASDQAVAVSDLLDLYSSELVHRISENLKARQRGEDTRPERPLLDADRPPRAMPAVRKPNF